MLYLLTYKICISMFWYNFFMNNIEKWINADTNEDLFMTKDLNDKEIISNISLFEEVSEFGTAGIRGLVGAGTKKINYLTIGLATEAYAQYLISNIKDVKKMGIVIANDNRRNGFLYRDLVSKIMDKHGIKTYIMDKNRMMATPLLSFLIRKLKAAGGVNITASHNPKEYNGYKVYNHLGAQLMPSETNKISKIMEKIDIFNVSRGELNPTIIEENLIELYIKEINDIRLNNNSCNNLKVAYSPLHGTGIDIAPNLFKKMELDFKIVEKQNKLDPEFSGATSVNPEESKSYNKVISLAKKNKSDLAMVTDPDADRVGAVVRHKKRYKYLTGNQIASVYLEYMLNQLDKKNQIPKDAYIIKSMVSTDLASKIAKSYNVEVREVNVGFKNIADMIENQKGTFLFGFEESYGMLINSNISRDKDAFQAMVGIIDMAVYFKNNNTNIYKQLKKIEELYGIHRNNQFSKILDDTSVKKTMNKIIKLKFIGERKIKKIIDFRLESTPQNMIKIFIDGGSWIVIRPSGTEPKVKFYIQSVGKMREDLMHAVIYEKVIEEKILQEIESFPDKQFSWKTVFKYTIFTLIVIGLMVFVFEVIYSNYSSSGNNLVESARHMFNSKTKLIFMISFISLFFGIIIDAIMKYRLLKFHGQSVKIRHLIISSIIGAIISFITPLSIGGDAIGYWYLRRKGFQKSALSSTFLTTTILWQMKSLVLTMIFVPLGIHMFKELFTSGTTESRTIMVLFVVGLSWDLFSILMIWMLVFSKKIQEWIVTTAIKLLEWMPFITISDVGYTASGYQYEFWELRKGIKKIWKSPKTLLESMFWEVLPKLFSISAFVPIALGIMNPGLIYGPYWSQIIASDIIGSANSFSLTPGSIGFVEFIKINVQKQLFVGGRDDSISLDIIDKFIFLWPYLLLSSLMVVLIVIGESRNSFYKKSLKNKTKNTKISTSFYKKTIIIWPIFIGCWIGLFCWF